jgi:hypothetical protein
LPLLSHLRQVHKAVTHESSAIADLKAYFSHYKSLNAKAPLHLRPHPTEAGCQLLGGADDQADANLRQEINRARLAALMEQQQAERQDRSFQRKCLFCKKVFTGDRAVLFRHMFEVHGFNIGLPDNLVGVPELLDILQTHINELRCIYCMKTFKSHSVLKLHMRKKKHFRIDPHQTLYDRFYIVNYLHPGKDWQAAQEDDNVADEEDNPAKDAADAWDDWVEDDSDQDPCVCLFCPHAAPSSAECLAHTTSAHGFDLMAIRKQWNLDTYDSIKLINYVRRMVHERRCPTCLVQEATQEALVSHCTAQRHFGLNKDSPDWRNAQYLFPTYENDALLCGLYDSDDEGDGPFEPDDE